MHVEVLERRDEDYRKALISAPINAKSTSSTIQKQVVNIFENQVRVKIRDIMGEFKFCIHIDEALDITNIEQMAILRCVH